MEKKFIVRVNVIICCIILVGFAAVGISSYYTYSKIIKDDIVNISKLTSTNIYSDINIELTKPIFVSLTMANDNFLKNWLKEEAQGDLSEAHQKELTDYLLGIKEKYNYDSVFMVSDASKYYYHFEGINKKISETDNHDQWYYNFVKSNQINDLEIDSDEVNHNTLSVFINCRIVDENDNLLGVTGVGLELEQIQELLKGFEDQFDLKAILFNRDGVVQIDTDSNLIGKINVFDNETLYKNQNEILNNYDSLAVYNDTENSSGGYIITRYIDDLDWYLLIKKDTKILEASFYKQIVNDIIIFVIVIIFVLLLSLVIIRKNDRYLMRLAKVDLLTNLLNRRGFNESIEEIIEDTKNNRNLYVFIFDIDNFKEINDIQGHLVGDSIIKRIGTIAGNLFMKNGIVSRWGGDEYAGYILGEKHEVLEILDNFFHVIRQDELLEKSQVTISLGVTKMHENDTLDSILYRGDRALYEAKDLGKNRYLYIEY